jgi:hypothetical protein
MKKQIISILIISILTLYHTQAKIIQPKIQTIKLNLQGNVNNRKNNYLILSKKDTVPSIFMGTLNLSKDFIPLLFVDKNIGVNLFEITAHFNGNIALQGFVSAGTNGQMLFSRLIKNGKIISQKSCGIGSPLRNGPFNYQTLVKTNDRVSIQIIVIDSNWQLHCCPDLYSCTYILTRNAL